MIVGTAVSVVRAVRPFRPIATGALFYDAVVKTGIVNADTVLFAVRNIVPRMMNRAKKVDSDALQAMIDLARSRVPQDTGKLLNGITGAQEGEFFVFRASAVKTRKDGGEGADYARFVEFGTKPGQRGRSVSYQSRAGFYTGTDLDASGSPITAPQAPVQPRRRRQYRGHPGTEAQPFFYNSAREVLEKRAMTYENMPAEVAGELEFGA